LNPSYETCHSDESFNTAKESNATDDTAASIGSSGDKSNNNKYDISSSSSSTNNNNNNNNNFIVNNTNTSHSKTYTALQPRKRCANETSDNYKVIPPRKKLCTDDGAVVAPKSPNSICKVGVDSEIIVAGISTGNDIDSSQKISSTSAFPSTNAKFDIGNYESVALPIDTENKENINEQLLNAGCGCNSNGKGYDNNTLDVLLLKAVTALENTNGKNDDDEYNCQQFLQLFPVAKNTVKLQQILLCDAIKKCSKDYSKEYQLIRFFCWYAVYFGTNH
jgi:hypothetical protein